MNNLIKIREQIKKAESLHKAQLLATKNGEMIPYRLSVYEDRLREIQKEFQS